MLVERGSSGEAAVAAEVLVAFGAEGVKLVISTETKRPARFGFRADAPAFVTVKAPICANRLLNGAVVRRSVQVGDHLVKMFPQLRELLGQLG
jgi:hypothetical protein